MITKSQTEDLKKLIGSRHIARISKYLNSIKVTNQHGEPFSAVYISRVFNGGVPHEELEKHIWDFAGIRTKEAEEEEKRREDIIQRIQNLQDNAEK